MDNTTYAAGMVGRAFSLDGVGDAVKIPASSSLAVQSFTMDAWIYPTTDNPGVILEFNKEDNNHPSFGPHIWVNPQGVLAGNVTEWGETLILSANNVFSLNQWSHVALTYDQLTGSATLYANGTEVGQKNIGYRTPNTSPPYGFFIGRRPASHNGPQEIISFTGRIDEVDLYDRALTAIEIAGIYNANSAGKCRSCTPPPSGLVSWWKAEGNALDSFGGNNGTARNGAIFGPGESGQAFSLDGTNQFIEVPPSVSLNLSTGMTLDAWVKPRSTNHVGILNKGAIGSKGAYELAIYLNKFYFQLNDGILNMPSQADIPANSWTHVAATYDGSTAKIYINGVLDNSAAYNSTINSNGYPLHIGLYGSPTVYFDGQLDEVTLYRQALSPEGIAAIYNAGSAGKCMTDRSPKPFAFVDQNGVDPNTVITSNTINVEEIDYATPISITACTSILCEYSINGGDFTTVTGTVNNGDTVTVQTDLVIFSHQYGSYADHRRGFGHFRFDYPGRQLADLSITKTSAPDPPVMGQKLTYTLTVSNAGPDAAEGVTVTDELSAALTFDSASVGCDYSSENRKVTCDLGSIGNGSQKTVEIEVLPTKAGPVSNTAGVTSSIGDPVPGNDSSVRNLMVEMHLYLPLIIKKP